MEINNQSNGTYAPYWIVAALLMFLVAQLCFFVYLYKNDIIIVFTQPLEFASLLLTAASLMLGATAGGIAILSLWGYRDIKKRAVEAARRAAILKAEETAAAVAARVAVAAQAVPTSQTSEQQVTDLVHGVTSEDDNG